MREMSRPGDAVTADRRGFLIGAGKVLLILPAGWALAACSSNENAATIPPTTNVSAGTLTFTSSVVSGHDHMFTMTMQEVHQPAGGGISRDTSVAQGHTHTVILSEAELSQIGMNMVVTKETSVTLDHSHSFSFSLAAAGTNTGAGGAGGTTANDGGAGAGG